MSVEYVGEVPAMTDAVLAAARRVVDVAQPGAPMPQVIDAVEALRSTLAAYDDACICPEWSRAYGHPLEGCPFYDAVTSDAIVNAQRATK